MFIDLNNSSWSAFEEALTPLSSHQRKSSARMAATIVTKAVVATSCLVVCPVTSLLAQIEKIAFDFFRTQSKKRSVEFSDILHNSKLWPKTEVIHSTLLETPLGLKTEDFLFGTASCTYQDSGFDHSPHSQWKEWEEKVLKEDNRSFQSANLFYLYEHQPEEIVDRLKKLGVNSYRTSIEWSQIEPVEGVYDRQKLAVYTQFCKHLKQNGIEPMVTLHHFSEPKWFHEKGSFEDEKNIEAFAKFSEFIYQNLTQEFNGAPLVKYFCTINEPSIEAMSRYVRGAFSPGIVMNFHRAALFLKGALKAHGVVYQRLKNINSNPEIKIGFTHQYLKFLPSNFLLTPVCRYLTRLINDVTLNLFKTSHFCLKIPFLCHVEETFSQEHMQADFVGIQYYTRPLLGLAGSIPSHSDEAMTQMPFREDPAGLYEAITDAYHSFKKPIIVTENGISTHNDEQRKRYMTRAIYAASMAEKDLPSGALLGYYQWSFIDNLEWDMGMKPQAFGAYQCENGIISENIKEGMEILKEVQEAHRSIWSAKEISAWA